MRKIITTIISLFYLLSSFGQPPAGSLKITHLTGDFYIYTTYNLYKGTPVPANGLYFITNEGAVIFDTPWDTSQFQPLLDSIKTRHNKSVIFCIATHFHDDRTAGLEYFRNLGIKTYTSKQTDELSKANSKKRAEFLVDKDTTFKIGQYSFQTYFPGHGHTPDNIVLWFEKEKILYGGCLIKSTEDDDLGNLGDANLQAYAGTVKNVRKKCKAPKFVIPGHGDWTNPMSLEHTLSMAEELKKKNNH
ncbi:BlaB/IND/MUS family subclass B1 metallo-beta-lactamase [Flavihumibacter profundi]|uniref:BlaB/IND/MUS family subclass B1 metallo-beta-lactamase n=1 Tax=Flavihumibacter profundi TaxID=2716883 RepID=UPI001CC5F44F|nr:BlaB/IND/MUS family subclass B1 metallo-beta-lactamase [Flavihumibacter profundi]MBZ5857723.1 BlaB/IND/MUS family subclass B1 metallo-beta-lactamase [Flavihumibacter profundi]